LLIKLTTIDLFKYLCLSSSKRGRLLEQRVFHKYTT